MWGKLLEYPKSPYRYWREIKFKYCSPEQLKRIEKKVEEELEKKTTENLIYDPPLDPEIKDYVEILNKEGIETFESCQGGKDHSYPEPTIRFYGEFSEGFRAFSIACQYNFPISSLQRIWIVIEKELTGPYWEIVLFNKKK